VWEGVRRSIVANRLRQQHALVADGMERLYADNIEPHRSAVAHHCAAAGRLLDAARYALTAGERCRQQHLLSEAASSWQRGIRWLESAQRSGEDPSACQALSGELWLQYGRVSTLLGDHAAAERWLMLAQELGSDTADAELEAQSSLWLGRMYRATGRGVLARAHLDAALQASYASTMPAPLGAVAWRSRVAVEALEILGMMQQEQGATAAAAGRFQLALQIAGSDDGLAARAMMGLAGRHVRAGETPEALALLDSAQQRAERSHDRILLGRVINAIGIAHYYAADYSAALEHFRRSVEIRQGLGYRSGVVVNYHNIGDAYLRMGDMGRAWAAFQRSRDLARAMGWSSGESLNEPFIAFIEGLPKTGQGEDIEAKAAARARMVAAAAAAAKLSDLEMGVSARWLLGRLLAAHGELDAAQRELEEALSAAQEVGVRPLIRDVLASLEAIGAR
ncbi:MAG: tetratricopeptide (TPR) repeat protein, partial [Myxococcota bacterium]